MMRFGQDNTQVKMNELYGAIYVSDVLDEQAIQTIENFAKQIGFEPAQVGGGNAGKIDSSIRRSNIAWLSPEDMPKEVAQHFEQLFIFVNDKHYKFDLTGFEAFQYTVYNDNYAGEYKWHIDTAQLQDNLIRKLSVSILLSEPNEYEGGKLLINPNGNIVVAEERKGRAVFFPSWMPHCVTPVTRGIRKSLVIWAHGAAFK